MIDFRRKPVGLVVMVSVIVSASFASTADFDSSKFQKVIEADEPADQDGLVAFALSDEIFAEVRPDFSNLRLAKRNSDRVLTEVPHFRQRMEEPEKTEPGRQWIPSKMISIEETAGNQLEMVVELIDKPGPATRLEVDTLLQDFDRLIEISGSSEGQSWVPLVKNGRIYDFARYFDIRKTEVRLPENDYRFFRVKISDAVDRQNEAIKQISRTISGGKGNAVKTITETVKDRPFRIDQLKWFTANSNPVENNISYTKTYPLENMEITGDPEQKQTHIHITSGNHPIDRFSIRTDDKNFRRAFSVLVRTKSIWRDNEETAYWKSIHRAHLFRFAFGDFHEEKLDLNFSEQRETEYKILIENKDNPPLKITDIVAEGPRYRLICLAEKGDRFALFFGGDEAQEISTPSYDTAAIHTAMKRKLPVREFGLGPGNNNPVYRSTPQKAKPFLNSPIFLWVIIGITVVLLSRVIFSLAKKVEAEDEK